MILRRLYATIGSRESCHLIIDGADDLPWELRIRRGIGTRFFLQKVEISGSKVVVKEECEYVTFGTVAFDDMEFFIYCIDIQVSKAYLEQPNSQLNSIPSSFLNVSSDLFPVLYSVVEPKVALSISSLEKLFIGSSRQCMFRLENRELLPEHLQLSNSDHDWYASPVTKESKFSLNGRIVNEKSILRSGDRLTIGSSELLYLNSEMDLNRFSEEVGYSLSEKSSLRSGYLSIEEGPDAPKSIPMVENKTFTIGRDPSYSLWIDKYFISRLHCTLVPRSDSLEVTDFSSNGTSVNGRKLLKDTVSIFKEPTVEIVLGPGVRLRYNSGSTGSDQQWSRDAELEAPLEIEKISLEESNPISNLDKQDELETHSRTFADYQKKTLRQMEENSSYGTTSSPFLSEGSIENLTEVPIQVGLSRFIPQVFIAALILILCVVFVIVARNIIL